MARAKQKQLHHLGTIDDQHHQHHWRFIHNQAAQVVLLYEAFRYPIHDDDMVHRLSLITERWESVGVRALQTLARGANQRRVPRLDDMKPLLLDRRAGMQLLILLWALEDAALDSLERVWINWNGLHPEERVWLYHQINRHNGHPALRGVGWRKAIGAALAENPISGAPHPRQLPVAVHTPALPPVMSPLHNAEEDQHK